jgi:NADH-ubiquinone oxidoreductase chain 1
LISLNLLNFNTFQIYLNFSLINIPITLVLIIIFLSETNRSPFDFAEGESELVSGFNVEYRRGGFSLIFLAEYSSILFIRRLFCIIILGGNIFSLFFFLKVLLLSFIYI